MGHLGLDHPPDYQVNSGQDIQGKPYVGCPDIRIRFGKAIRNRRKKLGVSQEEFADMCELDRTYLGGVERGERNLSLINIEKIALAFRVSLSELFKGV
jgi:DNA-binding XRE family transcriptional regulator